MSYKIRLIYIYLHLLIYIYIYTYLISIGWSTDTEQRRFRGPRSAGSRNHRPRPARVATDTACGWPTHGRLGAPLLGPAQGPQRQDRGVSCEIRLLRRLGPPSRTQAVSHQQHAPQD